MFTCHFILKAAAQSFFYYSSAMQYSPLESSKKWGNSYVHVNINMILMLWLTGVYYEISSFIQLKDAHNVAQIDIVQQ